MSNIRLYTTDKPVTLYVVLVIFLLVILFVNPLRETAVVDDWAYALTVQHLVETGEFQLHNWPAPNMLFQAYWGALFVRLFGYSFSSLRISTLVLAVLGLVAFYYLAREHGLDDVDAGLLTLGLLASPLVMRFSFSFMTDIPFLVCLIISLALYTRAIRLHSYSLMLFASLAAAAAILTRQAGIALLGGLCVSWLLSYGRKQQATFFLAGSALPAAAGLWQVYIWALKPSWAMQYLVRTGSKYLGSLAETLLTMLFWRSIVVLQYGVVLSLPLVFMGLLVVVRNTFMAFDIHLRKLALTAVMLAGLILSVVLVLAARVGIGRPGFGPAQGLAVIGALSLSVLSWWLRRSGMKMNMKQGYSSVSIGRTLQREGLLLGLSIIYILVGFLYYRYFERRLSLLLPYIPMGELCEGLQRVNNLARGILTLVTTLGVILILRMLIARYSRHQGWRREQHSEHLIDWVTLFLLIQQLVFPIIFERYVLVFLPFILVLVGLYLKGWSRYFRLIALVACLTMLVFSVLWTRGLMEFEEALWQGVEHVRLSGVQPNRIYGPWTWLSYYRFEDYWAETGGSNNADASDFMDRWLPAQREQAEFRFVLSPNAPPDEKWTVVLDVPYRDLFLRERHVYIVRREKSY